MDVNKIISKVRDFFDNIKETTVDGQMDVGGQLRLSIGKSEG
jgi:hypothetical protein